MGNISRKRKEMGEDDWVEYQKERHKRKNNKYYLKHMNQNKHWRGDIKKKLIEYKGGKCVMCGYNKPYLSVYCFHHKNPKEKEFGISGMKRKFENMKKEVDKCLLLCHNCHNELHEKEYLIKNENKQKNTGEEE